MNIKVNSNIGNIDNFEKKTISHPLWHGLTVVIIPPQRLSGIKSLFFNRAYIPLGDNQYVPTSNKDFLNVWAALKKSGCTLQTYQAVLLKNMGPTTRKEAVFAAALSLAKGEGYCDKELVVHNNWQDVANQIAIIFPRACHQIGKGGFGVVKAANGFIANAETGSLEKATFALKAPKDKEAATLMERGMLLLKKIWAPGLVPPSIHLLIPKRRWQKSIEWVMPTYTADFSDWAKKNREHPEKILRAFLTGFDGLEVLQKKYVVHTDLKPANLLVFEDGKFLFVDVNDFDGCFTLPTSLDAESLRAFKKDLVSFDILRTPHYSRKKEAEKLMDDLFELQDMLEIDEAKRDKDWLPAFSTLLKGTATLLQQIQIYEWGWSLFVALTGQKPSAFLPSKTSEQKEPDQEKIAVALAEMDEALKVILTKALDPKPANRPSLEEFKSSLSNYVHMQYDRADGHSHDTLSTRTLLGKSSPKRTLSALPSDSG